MVAEYKIVIWQEPQGLVHQAVRPSPFMAFAVGHVIEALDGTPTNWRVEAVSHSIYNNGTAHGHQIKLTVCPA
jgi:hypothetical protein